MLDQGQSVFLPLIKVVIDNFGAYSGEDSALHIDSFIHLNKWYSNYHHSHFASEETKAQMKQKHTQSRPLGHAASRTMWATDLWVSC